MCGLTHAVVGASAWSCDWCRLEVPIHARHVRGSFRSSRGFAVLADSVYVVTCTKPVPSGTFTTPWGGRRCQHQAEARVIGRFGPQREARTLAERHAAELKSYLMVNRSTSAFSSAVTRDRRGLAGTSLGAVPPGAVPPQRNVRLLKEGRGVRAHKACGMHVVPDTPVRIVAWGSKA